jgi:polyisoprenyl-phosphate glycosyltransferase
VNPLGYGVAAAVFLVGGFLLLCVGVLGEYLGRVYDEVRSRPLSIINQVYEASQSDSAQVNMGRREGDRKKPFRVA